MSEMDAIWRRLEVRVGRRFVEVMRAFVEWELKKVPKRLSQRMVRIKQTRMEPAFRKSAGDTRHSVVTNGF